MICPIPGKARALLLCEAFRQGAPRDAFGYVFFGVKAGNSREHAIAKSSGEPIYYIDNSYFDRNRGQRFRVGVNRLQVPARELATDGKRFDALGIEIQPWRHNAHGYWLALHQSPDHEYSAPGHQAWMAQAVDDLSRHRAVMHRAWIPDKAQQAQTLPRALDGAYGLVTHTSAGAVTAVIAGVQVIVSEQHALAGMVCSTDPAIDQRRRFLGVLADHEFTLDELKDGAAWRRLHP